MSPVGGAQNPIARPLRVARLDSSRAGDPDRGPQVRMNPEDAGIRLLLEGELAWVHGPRRHELAVVRLDADVPRGDVVLRDVFGASPSELVRVVKPEFDTPQRGPTFA